ncbi:MAG: energy-coupling factor transporter transmembrane component T [Syntrophomonadaceae bacterium]|nr:energy-coupling factor transporter transmembrane component T [Syntrophomonadaceae bacterium]
MKSAFAGYHPAVNFIYFTLMIGVSMFTLHPLVLLPSLLGAAGWALYLNGARQRRFMLLYLLPLVLLTAALNPLFNHRGATVLGYFNNGNPFTLESLCFGLAAGAMLAAVICWFSCFNAVITSDKIIYLFGRLLPAASSILALIFRFVPQFSQHMRETAAARQGLKPQPERAGRLARIRGGMAVLSATIGWSLETSIDTADSMSSRGYGLRGRTAFTLYRFERRDKALLGLVAGLSLLLLIGVYCGALAFSYFPVIRGAQFSAWQAGAAAGWLLLCALPLTVDVTEDMRWQRLRSKA